LARILATSVVTHHKPFCRCARDPSSIKLFKLPRKFSYNTRDGARLVRLDIKDVLAVATDEMHVGLVEDIEVTLVPISREIIFDGFECGGRVAEVKFKVNSAPVLTIWMF
jgi:hypothetical protein